MPQLDLFGAPVNPQPETKPADKLPAKKKEDLPGSGEIAGHSTLAREMRPEIAGGNKLKSRIQSFKKEEEKTVENEAQQALSLFSNVPGEVVTIAQSNVTSSAEEPKQPAEEEQPADETDQTLPPDEFAESKENLTDAFDIPELTADLLPIVVEEIIVEEKLAAPLVQTAFVYPAAGNGAVIFDDGKISVKIKAKPAAAVVEPLEKKEKLVKVPQKRGRKSFKEIDSEVDLIEVPEDDILFQKQYYPISEVAGWFKVNNSLLRFWENEFDVLKPRKNRKGDRLFRPEDVKNLQLIYQLLRQRKYTIEGAKEYIKTNRKKADMQQQLTQTLQKFRSFLLDLKANLQS